MLADAQVCHQYDPAVGKLQGVMVIRRCRIYLIEFGNLVLDFAREHSA
jgi:hypothetical protein